MQLTEPGQARMRGYLFVLKRSLQSFMPRAAVEDALREIESHLRERIAAAAPEPDERNALETLLADLGAPLEVARAYSAELVVEEALTTGRVGATARALWHLATTTAVGFVAALGLLSGYTIGLSFLAIAALKPICPDNVGVMVVNELPRAFGVFAALPAGAEIRGGYWVIPVTLALGLGTLVATHRGSHRLLLWWRSRRSAPTSGT